MIIRASKRILRGLLRELPITYVPYCISHFLNCLLGADYNLNPQPMVSDTTIGIDIPIYAYLNLTPSSLLQQIRDTILIRFRYSLPENFINMNVRKLPLLREICLRVGIQIVAQGYNFVKKKSKKRLTTFLPDDILNLIPTVKQANPRVIKQFFKKIFEGKYYIVINKKVLPNFSVCLLKRLSRPEN